MYDLSILTTSQTAVWAACIIAVAAVAYCCYVSAYLRTRTKKAKNVIDAQIAGRSGDPELVDAAVHSVWARVYTLSLVVLMPISALAAIWISSHLGSSPIRAGILAAGIALVLDLGVIHPLADGHFWERVELPAVRALLGLEERKKGDEKNDRK